MNSMNAWGGLPTLRHEIDRLFSRFDDDGLTTASYRAWSPSMDVCEKNGNLVVTVECPGMEAKDIRVSLTNDVLTIEGEKRTDLDDKTGRAHRRERSFGAFEREIRLPAPVDGSKITARLEHGVLTLTIPRTAEAKANTIPIQVH